MELKELKCKNCGASLKVEEDVTQVKCNFCDTTFAIEDAYTEAYKAAKGKFKAAEEHFEKAGKAAEPIVKTFGIMYLVFIVVFVIIFVMILATMIFGITKMFDSSNDFKNDIVEKDDIEEEKEETKAPTEEELKLKEDKSAAKSLTSTLDFLYVGTEYGSNVTHAMESVVTHNKKHANYQITVSYNGTSTKDPNEIAAMKSNFNASTKYEISYDYDSDNIITTMNISNS